MVFGVWSLQLGSAFNAEMNSVNAANRTSY